MNEKAVLFTIFGATGDLAKRKLYPSLFRLYKKGELAEHFAVIGTARRPWTNEFLREVVTSSIQDLIEDESQAENFASHFYYQSHDVEDTSHYVTLKNLGEELKAKYNTLGNQLFYLAMAPQFFGTIVGHLRSEEILTGEGFERLIIEKPFGSDYESAKKLNDELSCVFDEENIFRIDHYLGKEMIQNVTAVRFANHIFESIWNNKYIDNVQITFAESIGVEDRGGYYETSGALKDMVQNHILQVLSLLAMEPPTTFSDEEIRNEKVKALKAIRKYTEEEALDSFIAGQYVAGSIDGEEFVGYLEEPNVAKNSRTETFACGKFMIDNFRWSGVPFYVRTGKRMVEKGTRINVVFKQMPVDLFNNNQNTLAPNILTIYIQPTEGFSLSVNGKEIGQGFTIEPIKLSYRHNSAFLGNSPEAYEKLILDALNGERTNFSDWGEVARSWELIDVIRSAWDKNPKELATYKARTMGPKESYELLEKDGRSWAWKPEEWYIERGMLEE
ncbi:glucose-6-phosphate 1-dehydrogenase [Pilibacter termitis]|uniref:Glucose-6-phosphate 1-dehydrogenase n=1 Tax=Pilibacter termitis TaxID=263852 RepID=A0A1T4NG39_9ENTE|nr:glucose-6-phosphate dehydrogenase [Pilibacter termitis]SJZ78083.1 glucose-6-phosphate 1-dehydrogenase [Pilibacter termitis]